MGFRCAVNEQGFFNITLGWMNSSLRHLEMFGKVGTKHDVYQRANKTNQIGRKQNRILI